MSGERKTVIRVAAGTDGKVTLHVVENLGDDDKRCCTLFMNPAAAERLIDQLKDAIATARRINEPETDNQNQSK